MIYWILANKLKVVDWYSEVEGFPGYFYENIQNLVFLDISEFGFSFELQPKVSLSVEMYDIRKLDSKRYISIKNKKDYLNFISNINKNDCFVFQEITTNYEPLFIFWKKLKRFKFKKVLLAHWKIASSFATNMSIFNAVKNLNRYGCLEKIKAIIRKILTILFSEKLFFDYAIIPCEYVKKEILKSSDIGCIIPCHTIGYSDYIANKCKDEKKYILYVDQALTIHPDNTRSKEGDYNIFHKEIISTLDSISENEKLPVIIAAHPKIQFPEGFWEKYEVYKGNTLELINSAKIVIGHFSTVLTFAKLLHKDIRLLISNSSYFYWNDEVFRTAKELKLPVYEMSTLEKVYNPDEQELDRNAILQNYSLTPDDNRSNKEILFDFFINL